MKFDISKKKRKEKEIIEVMKFDISKSQYAIFLILYKLLHCNNYTY